MVVTTVPFSFLKLYFLLYQFNPKLHCLIVNGSNELPTWGYSFSVTAAYTQTFVVAKVLCMVNLCVIT